MKKIVLSFLIFVVLISFSKTIHISSDYVEPTDSVISYSGNIVVLIEPDNLSLKTERMEIEKIQNKWILLSATGTVQISFDKGELEGENLSYNIETQYGTIEDSSLTIIDSKSSETIFINCEKLNFDLLNNVFEGNSKNQKIEIIKGSITAYSNKFFYNKEKGELILEDNVELIDKEKNIKIKAVKIILNTENNNLKGEKVQVEIVVE
ncbi:hypothetical protein [Thermosipho atlanticus]|uniref:OstA-like protein n=1 Tax=Thermosipho atlanticus DSM 15807 TaxID=1123380 RepID=A0A1M5R0Y0_9BACT|nr:hypothetical protein [Thermosipho atlanticus]SHH19453.1 hypothetical protein SAMN02745199_0247 [Thermosipho atlanticus DSM 15807]